jgi:DNA-binding SARP family transcriptional activator/ActR/RegA family two-component response regulator
MTHSSKILVVEDRSDWQDIVCQTIGEKGYVAHSATTYQEALAVLEAHQFNLAIVDPVLDRANRFNRDGLSVIQRIGETQPDIPIIIITGSLTRDLKRSFQALCPDSPVLFKESWDPVEFGRLLDNLLGKQQVAEVTTAEAAQPQSIDVPVTPLTPPPLSRAIGHPRVLVVENREDWQYTVASILEEADCFWRVARNAQEALQEMEQETFHLVVLDLKLQQHDLPLRSTEGWLLLDHLVETQPKTKIVVLSGRASAGDVADLLTHYPIVTFIEKQSFNPQAIRDVLAQAAQTPQLRIQTFGQFRLWRDGQAIEVWERPQAEVVLKMLLIRRARGGRAVAADELITRLWPDSDEESGRKKLLPLISNARRTLEPDIEPRDSNFILRCSNGYFFDLNEGVNWDLLEFRRHLSQGRRLIREDYWEEAVAELEKGRALYRGDFMAEDRYADWVIDMRREITTDFCDLLIQLADAYAALGRYPQAIDAGETALRKDPLLESVYRRLMRFHYCNGDKGQALKVYRDCLKVFEELFGESPTPATRQLYQAIADDEPVECLAKE